MKKKKHLYVNFDKIYKLAKKNQQALQLQQELSSFTRIFFHQKDLMFFLENNRLSFQAKKEFLERALKSFSPLTLKLILFLVENRKIRNIDQMSSNYTRYLAEKEKIVFIKVVTAFPLKKEQEETLKNILKKKYPDKIILEKIINPRVLNGMVIKVFGGRIWDFSLKTKLAQLKHHLIKL